MQNLYLWKKYWKEEEWKVFCFPHLQDFPFFIEWPYLSAFINWSTYDLFDE